MSALRSLLFVPANRPDRFTRALESGADAVCIDLEDAVAPEQKTEARAVAADFLRQRPASPRVGVRINAVGGEWAGRDILEAGRLAAFIMLPKAEAPEQLAQVSNSAPGTPLWPLVETTEGLRCSWDIAAASSVEGVVFGAFDYAAEVGCAMEWESLLFARSQLAAACARARIELLDAPAADVRDHDTLDATTRRAKALGFTGRSCIHPDQVAAVNAAFTPTPAELDRARRVVEAFAAARGQAAQLDGRLIELPVALAARRVLSRAGE